MRIRIHSPVNFRILNLNLRVRYLVHLVTEQIKALNKYEGVTNEVLICKIGTIYSLLFIISLLE